MGEENKREKDRQRGGGGGGETATEREVGGGGRERERKVGGGGGGGEKDTFPSLPAFMEEYGRCFEFTPPVSCDWGTRSDAGWFVC